MSPDQFNNLKTAIADSLEPLTTRDLVIIATRPNRFLDAEQAAAIIPSFEAHGAMVVSVSPRRVVVRTREGSQVCFVLLLKKICFHQPVTSS